MKNIKTLHSINEFEIHYDGIRCRVETWEAQNIALRNAIGIIPLAGITCTLTVPRSVHVAITNYLRNIGYTAKLLHDGIYIYT